MGNVRRWAALVVVSGLMSTTAACSGLLGPADSFESTGDPTWKCVEVHDRYGNAVPVLPVPELLDADEVDVVPVGPRAGTTPDDVAALATAGDDRASAEAFAIGMVALVMEVGDEIPPVWDHLADFGDGVAPRDVVLQTGHACKAWVGLGRSWEVESPTWVRSRESDEGRRYAVEVAGTVMYVMHPDPEQPTRVGVDVVHTSEGWRVESFTGPVKLESPPLLGARYRSTVPTGKAWREARPRSAP